jgi:hypothetical protein
MPTAVREDWLPILAVFFALIVLLMLIASTLQRPPKR